MYHLILISLFMFGLGQCNETTHNSNSMLASTPDLELPIDTNWTTKVKKSDDEWQKILTKEQYYITRQQGTERPFTHPYNDNHEDGVFLCVSCKNPLFSSKTKFNSGTGWPSFFKPISLRSVDVGKDMTLGMVRDEVTCSRCDAHLGHVFDDGPKPTGLRYCMNGTALLFEKAGKPTSGAKALFAAGCFWCLEAIYENIKGVKSVVSGYAGGNEPNPTYESVGAGQTHHAEAIEVVYDPMMVSFADLVKVFYASQDPTQVNGQGPDHGPQYRSIAFYNNDSEKKIIEDYIQTLTASKMYSKPIATQVLPTSKFWIAEDYHQDYVKHHPENPYVQHESIPRMKRAFSQIKDLLKISK